MRKSMMSTESRTPHSASGSRLAVAVALGVVLSAAPGYASADSISSPDPNPESGRDAALVLDRSGNPAVAYFSANPGGPLSLLRCDDPACAGTGEIVTTVDADVTEQDSSVSIAVNASNNPVVVYGARGAVWFLTCDDPFCRNGTDGPHRVVDGSYPSMVLDTEDRPVIAFANRTSPRELRGLAVMHCNDPRCSGDDDPVELPDSRPSGPWSSIAIGSDGNPAIAYGDGDGALGVMRCNDPNCAGGDESVTEFDHDGGGSYYPELRLDDQDRPAVLFTSGIPKLYLLRCNDPACAGDDDRPASPFPWNAYDAAMALAANGAPIVLYEVDNTASNGEMRLRRCTDVECGEGSPDHLVELGYTWGPSLAVDSDDHPVGAYFLHERYFEGSMGLRILQCDDPLCNSDNDGDGVNDVDDEFPFDAAERLDTDGDGIGDLADDDDDGDGQLDTAEETCGSDPLDATSRSPDSDGDGTPDCLVDTLPTLPAPPSTLPATGAPSTQRMQVGLAALFVVAGLALGRCARRSPSLSRHRVGVRATSRQPADV